MSLRRILLLITDLEIGGTPTVVRELALRLRGPNVHIEVASLKHSGPVSAQLSHRGINVTSLDASSVASLPSVVRRLRELIRQHQIDTVFSFLLHANAVAAVALRQLPEVRFLQSIQTVQREPRWHWWVQRLVQRAAERIVVPSNAVAEVAQERCGIETHRVTVIANAIDPTEFPRARVFADPKQIRVGFLGRLDPVKQVPHFVDSVAFVDPLDVRVEGHIFGDGPDRANVEKAVEECHARDRFFVHGAVSSPQEALRQMDVLFLTSLGEGFGLVLIEAMASGVPVIAYAAGGVTDIVQDGVNGFALYPENFAYRRIWTDLEKLRTDVPLRQRIIDNALTTVRTKFTWDIVLPHYRALLRINQTAQASPPWGGSSSGDAPTDIGPGPF